MLTSFQVAQVYLAPRILPSFLFYGKNLPTEMLKAGWAVTYEQVRLDTCLTNQNVNDVAGWC